MKKRTKIKKNMTKIDAKKMDDEEGWRKLEKRGS